jgi:hypothetical protein
MPFFYDADLNIFQKITHFLCASLIHLLCLFVASAIDSLQIQVSAYSFLRRQIPANPSQCLFVASAIEFLQVQVRSQCLFLASAVEFLQVQASKLWSNHQE